MAARCALSGLLRFVWWVATPYPAYGRLLNLSYQTVVQFRRPAQAQRRRAGCIRRVPVVVADDGYALSGLRKAAEPELSNSCSTPQARASAAPPGRLYPTLFPLLCRMAATPYPAYGRLLNLSYQTVAQLCRPAQAPRRAAPPGRLYPTPFPSLCRMAATPYPAYGRLLNLSYQTVAQLRRPAQAPRRRAGCIQRYSPRFAGWRLRLIRPTEGC